MANSTSKGRSNYFKINLEVYRFLEAITDHLGYDIETHNNLDNYFCILSSSSDSSDSFYIDESDTKIYKLLEKASKNPLSKYPIICRNLEHFSQVIQYIIRYNIIPSDQIVMLQNIGSQKHRFLVGELYVITKDRIFVKDIDPNNSDNLSSLVSDKTNLTIVY